MILQEIFLHFYMAWLENKGSSDMRENTVSRVEMWILKFYIKQSYFKTLGFSPEPSRYSRWHKVIFRCLGIIVICPACSPCSCPHHHKHCSVCGIGYLIQDGPILIPVFTLKPAVWWWGLGGIDPTEVTHRFHCCFCFLNRPRMGSFSLWQKLQRWDPSFQLWWSHGENIPALQEKEAKTERKTLLRDG